MLNKELRTVIHKIVWVILLLSGFNAGIADAEWAKVRQVIDGDTVILETNQHVRLIGVDTPEIKSQYNSRTEYFALQAKQFVEQMTEGRKVFLGDDDAQASFDKYGRRLREAAKRLDLTEERVRELINLMEIKAAKVGKWRIHPDHLEKFIKSNL